MAADSDVTFEVAIEVDSRGTRLGATQPLVGDAGGSTDLASVACVDPNPSCCPGSRRSSSATFTSIACQVHFATPNADSCS